MMAKATVKYKEPVRPIESVTLTLNQDELVVLTAILNRIGGSPDKSPRKHAGSILNAIKNGVDRDNRDYSEVSKLVDYNQGSAHIYFRDYPIQGE
jgi:hypothetical protein